MLHSQRPVREREIWGCQREQGNSLALLVRTQILWRPITNRLHAESMKPRHRNGAQCTWLNIACMIHIPVMTHPAT